MQNLSHSTDLILFSDNRVFILQQPKLLPLNEKFLTLSESDDVVIVDFCLPQESSVFEQKSMHLELIRELLGDEGLQEYTVWTNRAKSVSLIRHMNAASVIYDRDSEMGYIHPAHLQEMDQYADVFESSNGNGKVFEMNMRE
ncbi:MAG: hypothetical protein V4598_00625 [Bdellovibrionota bacterium]